MRAVGIARLILAVIITGLTACSIWAAISDPYKSDTTSSADVSDSGTTDTGARGDTGRPQIDSGIYPYAITAYDDSVYVVGAFGQVQVARGANQNFVSFWRADGGELFYPRSNGVSASDAGLFWTVSTGIHYCALDGGACGLLPSASQPKAIAASDSVVAWIDNGGVQECTVPLSLCTPSPQPASKGAISVTAGAGTIAWLDGKSTVHIARTVIDLAPYVVSVIGIDRGSGDIYWSGLYELGAISPAGSANRIWSLGNQGDRPDQLFAASGLAYWTLSMQSAVFYCHVNSDAGCSSSLGILASNVMGSNENYGIAATTREVFAVIGSTNNTPREPVLVGWPIPR
jgi:hypothetical protein